MARYAIKRSDGGVTVLQTINGATPEECIAKWMPEDQATVVEIVPISDGDVPTDRTFRNAWGHNDDGFHVHMDHAKEIWRGKMRLARQPLLEALDVEYQRADEGKAVNKKAEIAKKKQVLRDVTDHPDLEAATTPEQIKNVWPTELGTSVPDGIPLNTGLLPPSAKVK